MANLFSDGFECPPNTAPATFTAWTTKVGSPTIDNSITHSGTYCMLVDGVESVYKTITQSALVYARCYINVHSFPSSVNNASLGFMRFGNGTTRVAELFFNYRTATNPHVNWQLFYRKAGSSLNVVNNADIPSVDTWCCVELLAQMSTVDGNLDGNYRVYINGVEKTALQQLSVDTDYTYIDRVQIGATSNTDSNSMFIDCLVVADAYIGLESSGIPKFCLINEMGY